MKLTITFIKLKSPFKFFALSKSALSIVKQIQTTNHKGFKKKGFWTKHYTMTLWDSKEDLTNFAKSGAHLKAMQDSAKIAKEIRTITIDRDNFPSWKEAKKLLEKTKPIIY